MATLNGAIVPERSHRSDKPGSDDPLKLLLLDNPAMSLVPVLLTETNYLTWSRSVRHALTAKNKIGFINGGVPESGGESEKNAWKRVNEMVIAWILNSISKEIAETFVYSTFASGLWTEIGEQFGGSNGPQIYQIQRQISSLEQGDLSVVLYYGKMKKLWEELNFLQLVPQCSCGVIKNCKCDTSGNIIDIIAQNHLIQFLMGLNDEFDNVRNQILVMDPLPSVNKAYSLILRVEK